MGWTEGRNARASTSAGARAAPSIRGHAAELIALAPDLILTAGSPITGRGAAGDPHRADRIRAGRRAVGAGFVESLARPGGNATGFTSFEYSHGRGSGWSCSKEIAPG